MLYFERPSLSPLWRGTKSPPIREQAVTNLAAFAPRPFLPPPEQPPSTVSLITVNALSKSYGHVDIFSNLTFGVAKGARLGIVGPNGIGKTTLLRILAGLDEPSSGTIHRARGIRIGYLPQEADFQMTGTLWQACESVFSDLIQAQEELARLEREMAGGDDPILERYGRLQHEFERRGGYTYPARIRQVLSGLGFDQSDYTLQLDHLSGGQRTRAFLARAPALRPGCAAAR